MRLLISMAHKVYHFSICHPQTNERDSGTPWPILFVLLEINFLKNKQVLRNRYCTRLRTDSFAVLRERRFFAINDAGTIVSSFLKNEMGFLLHTRHKN
jgi:hypothetical protein